MPGGKIKYVGTEEESSASSEATVTQPGSLPGGKAVIKGTGTHADPYIGYIVHGALNFNAASVTVPLMVESGQYSWMRIKKVIVYYDAPSGAPGVTIYANVGVMESDGSTGMNEVGLCRPITTTSIEDVYCWDFGPDGVLLWRGPMPYNATAPAGGWSGSVVFYLANYAATDDISIYIECEWAVRQ